MSENVPRDVWMNIFGRLPIKTLLQIMSVCKVWRSVICNPDFVTDHHNNHNDERLIRVDHKPGAESSLLLTDGSALGERILKLHFPFVNRWSAKFWTIDSCNGVICLSDRDDNYALKFTLWNPSIRKYVNLPKPSVNPSFRNFGGFGSQYFALGFGFDQKSKDYKVVRVAYMNGRNGRRLIPPEVQVYSWKSNSWRIFHSGAPPYGLDGPRAFVNGAVHWIGYDPCRGNRYSNLIVAFDFSDETFREIMLPDELIDAEYDLSIMVYKDSISVYHYEISKNTSRVRKFSVWVMEAYGVVESWSKLHADIPVCREFQEMIALRNNGDVLCRTQRGKLVNFSSDSGFIDLEFSAIAVAAGYTESLVLVDGRSTEKFEEDEDEDEGN